MGIRDKISKLLRRRREHRHAPLATASAAEMMQTLTTQQRLDEVRVLRAKMNPLLAHGYKVFSQNDEDGIIQEICRRLNVGEAGSFLEIGVGDGSENNTLNLLVKGWRGVWLGGEPLSYADLMDRLVFEQSWITRDNVAGIIQRVLPQLDIRALDLMSIDIDGNDWHIAQSVLESGIRPSTMVVEYNGTFDAHTEWVMPYDDDHRWDKSAYFGASLASFHRLFKTHGYFLAACNSTGVNAFFVKEEFRTMFQELPDDWRSIFMPANYHPYPYLGHPVTQRLIGALIGK